MVHLDSPRHLDTHAILDHGRVGLEEEEWLDGSGVVQLRNVSRVVAGEQKRQQSSIRRLKVR